MKVLLKGFIDFFTGLWDDVKGNKQFPSWYDVWYDVGAALGLVCLFSIPLIIIILAVVLI